MSWLDTLEQIRTRDFTHVSKGERDRAARDVVNMCSYAVAAAAITPLPFVEAVVTLPVQLGMVMTVGHIYGRSTRKAEAKELLVEIGAVAGVNFVARQGIKALLPVLGALLTAPAAFGANWAIGRVAMEHFKNPGMAHDELRKVYQAAAKEAGALFSRTNLEKFRKRHAQARKAAPARRKAAPGKKATPRRKKRRSGTKR